MYAHASASESVCMCAFVCVYACIHLIPAGFPVQSPLSDTADDGCAVVICFIGPGVSLTPSITPLPSTSGKGGITNLCHSVIASLLLVKITFVSFMQKKVSPFANIHISCAHTNIFYMCELM